MQYLLNTSFLNGKHGADAVITRLAFRSIAKEDILDAMKNNFHGFNSGIVTEEYGNQLVKDFGLSYAHAESFHTGCSVFKRY